MGSFVVRKGAHIGRGHIKSAINCQDAHTLYEGVVRDKKTVIGIICDGCSEGKSSEVGAKLATEFLIRETLSLLNQGVPIGIIPGVLYGQLIEFLRGMVGIGYDFVNMSDKVNFIKDYLLFTVVGFILTEDDIVIFSAGDGTIVINEETILIDQHNKPTYPAYHLVDRSRLEADASALPTSFDTIQPNRESLWRLAIGSDAWHLEKELLEKIWGFKNPAGLQRQINIWSEKDKRFEDDVTAIAVEVTPDTVQASKTLISTPNVS